MSAVVIACSVTATRACRAATRPFGLWSPRIACSLARRAFRRRKMRSARRALARPRSDERMRTTSGSGVASASTASAIATMAAVGSIIGEAMVEGEAAPAGTANSLIRGRTRDDLGPWYSVWVVADPARLASLRHGHAVDAVPVAAFVVVKTDAPPLWYWHWTPADRVSHCAVASGAIWLFWAAPGSIVLSGVLSGSRRHQLFRWRQSYATKQQADTVLSPLHSKIYLQREIERGEGYQQ